MSKPKFYITTPIYYVNDMPHIGHAYTTVAADVLARYRRLKGYEVFFLTGTDEHGQKVEEAALKRGETPIALADRMSDHFRQLWRRLNISNNDFIRTTEERHIRASQALFQTLYEKGDIYKGHYEDWYCTPCETYWTETQFEQERNCPSCGRPTQKLKEESYFFRLSKYQQPLLEYIETNPNFILPPSRRNEVLSFIQGGLRDLSVTRTSFKWGVTVPLDDKHIMYVWLDALTNYLTAIGYPDDMPRFSNLWPADVHLLAKDILRFHAVYWPAFLMSAGLAPPRQVVVHGWWTVDGQKMSKSLGNVVDPHQIIDQYGVDALRYFLLREVPFGNDGDFSQKAFIARLNADLANDLGNLVSRSLAMLGKYFDGLVPTPRNNQGVPKELRSVFEGLAERIGRLYDEVSFNKILVAIWEAVGATNKYIEQMAPWALNKDPSQRERLATVMYNVAEALRIISVLIWPFMPQTADKIWQQLGINQPLEQSEIRDIKSWGNLPPGIVIAKGLPLFPRVEQ
jgi:methionyl-tRNA synthetase